MLDSTHDRIDYGEQLTPPSPGYHLDFAVGTTYSLDLNALMVVPVAMLHSKLLDNPPEDVRLDVMDAITRCASRIRVFFQQGKIKVPRRYNRLMAYWEASLVPIRMPIAHASFHPKVWVARFVKKGNPAYYRFLSTSRNLTFARDWDIASTVEGECGATEVGSNRPLIEFLEYLQIKSLERAGEGFPKPFLEELTRVKFHLPDDFDRITFHPIGIAEGQTGEVRQFVVKDGPWEELLAVSPFIDDSSIIALAQRTKGLVRLFSRREELDKVSVNALSRVDRAHIFKFSELIRDGEGLDGLSDGSRLEPQLQDIHAKLFVGRRNKRNHWFIGSANCTGPAFEGRNSSAHAPSKLAKVLTHPVNGQVAAFEPYEFELRQGKIQNSFDMQLRWINYALSGLTYVGSLATRDMHGETIFDLMLKVDATALIMPDDFESRVRPVAEIHRPAHPLTAGIRNVIDVFSGYEVTQISPFLEIEICHQGQAVQSFLVEMNIELPAGRLDAIFRSIINDTEKFMRYLSFLLGGDGQIEVSKGGRTAKRSNPVVSPLDALGPGLYEELMISISRKPERLAEARKLFDRLKDAKEDGKPVIPETLLRFWFVFDEHMKREGR